MFYVASYSIQFIQRDHINIVYYIIKIIINNCKLINLSINNSIAFS